MDSFENHVERNAYIAARSNDPLLAWRYQFILAASEKEKALAGVDKSK